MMEQLNRMTFGDYGELLSPDSEIPLRLREQSERRAVRPIPLSLSVSEDEVIILPQGDGAGVLHIQTAAGLVSFLFTSPVRLVPGVRFGISSLSREFICTCFTSVPLSVCSTEPLSAPRSSSVAVSHIYYALLQEKESGYRFTGETHDFYELTYVDQGHLFNTVDDTTYLLKQGDLQFFLHGQRHTQYGYQDESVSFASIAFDLELPEQFSLTNAVFASDLEERRILLDLFRNERSNALFQSSTSLCLLTLLVLCILRRLYDVSIKPPILVEASSTSRVNDKLVDEVLRQIRLDPTIKASELAKRVSMSSSYLSRMIVQRTGKSISDWRIEIRLGEAKELLRKGISVTDVASQLHYPSVGYLSTEFKKAFGVTPREYSKSLL